MSFPLSHVPLFPPGRSIADEWYGRKGFVGVLHLVGSDEPCREVSPDAQRQSAKALEALDQVWSYLKEQDFSLFKPYYEAAPNLGGHLMALQDNLKPLREAFEDPSLFQALTESTPTRDFLHQLRQLAKVQRDLAPISAVQEDLQAILQAIDKQLPSDRQDRWVRRAMAALSVLGIAVSVSGFPYAFLISLFIIISGAIREERNDVLKQQKKDCEPLSQTLNHLAQHSPIKENRMDHFTKLTSITVNQNQSLQEALVDMEQRLSHLIMERTGGSAPVQSASEKVIEAKLPPAEDQPKSSEKTTHEASSSQTLPDMV